jgi:lipopolysaccharide export system permease protein
LSTIRRYVLREFVVTFTVSLLVLSFVLTAGALFKITEIIGRGASWRPVLMFFLWGMPQSLTFSIPVSILTSCLLVFGRLSADGEITAMRACGINMWRVMSGPLFAAALLSLVCVYVNAELAPRGRYARREVKAALTQLSPMDLLEEGRFMKDFAGMTVYIGRRQGEELQDVRLIDLRNKGIKREIRAKRGLVRADGGDLVIDLQDVRVDPFFDDRPGAGYCTRLPIRMAGALEVKTPTKLTKDKTSFELLAQMAAVDPDIEELDAAERQIQAMKLAVELQQRWVLSAACLAFAMLGMPLGVKTHRKESSIGVAVSLLLVFAFYVFIIVSRSLTRHPEWRPDLIVWAPVAIGVILGAALVARSD